MGQGVDSIMGALRSISTMSLSCHKAAWASRAAELDGKRGDKEIDPSDPRELTLRRRCRGYVVACAFACMCVCSYTERPWQGQWFSCHSGALRCDWPGSDRSGVWGGFHVRKSSVWGLLCVHRGRHRSITSPNVTTTELCRSTSPYRPDMLWPYPARWYLGVITLYWYTGGEWHNVKTAPTH